MPAGAIYVGRPSPFGNYAGNTKDVFDADIETMSNADRAFFYEQVSKLAGKDLVCWCALEKPCHADTLLEIGNQGVPQ